MKEIRFNVGEGGRVKFWKDDWCGNVPLLEEFSHLFVVRDNKDAWVRDYPV